MSNVIKAGDRRATRGVAFNLDDVASQAVGCIDKIRAEAAHILEQTSHETALLRRQAEAEGLLAAHHEIDRLLDERLRVQLETVMPALRQASQEILQARQAWLAHWEKQAVHLAVAIAQRVIRRELQAQPEIPLELVREALQLAAGAGRMRVLMNPDDVKALGAQVQTLIDACAPAATTELIAVPSITPGGCRVDTDFGSIDQQFDSQLRRIEEELA